MAKIHADGLVPDRNVVSAGRQTLSVTPDKNLSYFEADLDATEEIEISMPEGFLTDWFLITFLGPPANDETNLTLYLDGDDTSDAAKGFPVQYHGDTHFISADGTVQNQGHAPIHFPVRATKLVFKSGEANNVFSVVISAVEERDLGRNSRKKLNT